MALGLIAPSMSQAGVTFSVTNPLTAQAGTSGSFDILIHNDDSSSVDVNAFGTLLEVATNTGLSFTGADGSTLASSGYGYIFGSVQDPSNFATFSPSYQLNITDGLPTATGVVTLAAGETKGLAHVLFSLSSSAYTANSPNYQIALTFTSGLSGAYGANYSTIVTLTNDGTLAVTPATAVPEPGTMVMGGLLAMAGGLASYRSVRRQKVTA